MACRLAGAKPVSEQNAGIFISRPLWTKLIKILIEIHTFFFNKMHMKMSFAKSRPFCLDLDVLKAFWLTNNANILTHWGRDKIVDIFGRHINSVLGNPISNMTTSIGSDIVLALNRRQAIIWTNDGFVYWRIHGPLLLDVLELRHTIHSAQLSVTHSLKWIYMIE